MNRFSIINIGNILKAFNKSIEGFHKLFYVAPIVVGFIFPFVLWHANEQAAGALNAFLTSFVPLFATILTFYISWCYNKLITRHNEERLRLFRETSTNILMMIPLDVFALLMYVLSNNHWFDSSLVLGFYPADWMLSLPRFLVDLTWHQAIRFVFLFAYYSLITEIILIVLMVCKRAFVIINHEITLLNEDNSDHQ